MRTVYLVIKYWPGGKRETMVGYFTETLARNEAGKIIGHDGAMVALETVDIHDAEPQS